MSTDLAITLTVSSIIGFVGAVTYLHDRKSISNVFFLFISLATALWAIANYYSLASNPYTVLIWIRLVLFFAVPHAIFFLLFIYHFPRSELRMRKSVFLALISVLALTMLATVSPFVFSSIEVTQTGAVIPIPGPLMPFFASVVFGSLCIGIFEAIRKYVHSESLERTRWRIMLFGTLLSYFMLIITNFVFVIIFKQTLFIEFGPLFMLPMIIGTAYAIFEHNLLHVKVITSEIAVFIILVITFIGIWAYEGYLDLFSRIGIFAAFFVFGIFLIRSVIKEVEQREKLQLLTKELESANRELTRLDKAKSEFVSIASHQLRTPLTAIKGYISLLREGTYGNISEIAKKPLENVYASNERLIRLVNDLLSLSRIESGKIQMEWDQIRIDKTIESVIDELRVKADQKKLVLRFDKLDSPLPDIRLDEDKIRNVVMNFIDNAIRYTEKGSITVRTNFTPKKVLISIADTGAGMNESEIGRLFQSFSRGSAGAKSWTGGSGLGLYIAKQFVEMHSGRVWVESAGKGKGSTFFIELPRST